MFLYIYNFSIKDSFFFLPKMTNVSLVCFSLTCSQSHTVYKACLIFSALYASHKAYRQIRLQHLALCQQRLVALKLVFDYQDFFKPEEIAKEKEIVIAREVSRKFKGIQAKDKTDKRKNWNGQKMAERNWKFSKRDQYLALTGRWPNLGTWRVRRVWCVSVFRILKACSP